MEAQEREQEKEKMKQIIQKREIKHLFHFTPIENLDYILKDGLKSRELIEQERNKYPDAIFPDKVRADRRINGICLSISFPNHSMFYSHRMQFDSEWVVILLDINLILEINDRQIYFFQTNSANKIFINSNDKDLETADAFEALFADSVKNKIDSCLDRPPDLPKKYPTDVQAEVMITNYIERDYIRYVVFNNESLMKTVHKEWQKDYKFCCSKKLFDSREYYLMRIHG